MRGSVIGTEEQSGGLWIYFRSLSAPRPSNFLPSNSPCVAAAKGSLEYQNATHERRGTIQIHPVPESAADFEYSGRIYCRHMNETSIYLLPHLHSVDICGFNLVERRGGGFRRRRRKTVESPRKKKKRQHQRIWIFMDVPSRVLVFFPMEHFVATEREWWLLLSTKTTSLK